MAPQPQSPSNERARRAQLLDRLLRAERARLLRQARFHSHCTEDSEDALSEACIQFLRFYDGPAGDHALRWMMVVVKRCAWALGRQARTRQTRCQVADSERVADELAIVVREQGAGPDELAERSEETARVIAMLERLKPDERAALILFGLGCSYAEISELRGWTYTKVNRCVSEGRARVRELLSRGAS